MKIFQEFWGHIARGAARGALHAFLGKQVKVEKRDAPENEKLDAREEVEIKVSVLSVDTSLVMIPQSGSFHCNFKFP